MEAQEKESKIYILFGGKLSVGKSLIAQRYTGINFQVGIYHKKIQKSGFNLNIVQIDTGGEEIYGISNSFKRYYKIIKKNACIILVYDITDRSSFEEMINYYQMLTKIQDRKFTYLLLGNKIDQKQNRQISFDEAKSFADSCGILFFEVSAITKENLEESYDKLIELQIQKSNYLQASAQQKQ